MPFQQCDATKSAVQPGSRWRTRIPVNQPIRSRSRPGYCGV